MNAPSVYAQPYGAPMAPYPPFHPPQFAPYAGVGNTHLQPWGYGHYPTGPLPNPVPHPVAMRPDNTKNASPVPVHEAPGRTAVVSGVEVVERDAHTEARGMDNGKNKSTASNVVEPRKSYPNKQVSEGVWQFLVEVESDRIRQRFIAETNMSWPEFKNHAYERFDTPPVDVRLGYRISADKRSWMPLTCESDWKVAIGFLEEKMLKARTRPVTMELTDISKLGHRSKARPGEKRREKKRTRDDDIPPEPTPEAKRQDDNLRKLQKKWLCQSHSGPGLRTYCWVEPATQGSRGGHREINHDEMTLWAKHIELGKATEFLPPNVKKFNRPPTKKPRGAQMAPEVHVAVNITPMPGVGIPATHGSYAVSGTPIEQSGSASAPGPQSPAQVSHISDIAVHTETSSAPAPTPMGHTARVPSSLIVVLDCFHHMRIPTAYEILTLMDIEVPAPNLRYVDALSDLQDLGYKDVIDIYGLQECFLASFGHLGRDGACRVRQYTRDRFLVPLGLMEGGGSPSVSDESVIEIDAPSVRQHNDEGDGQSIKVETEIDDDNNEGHEEDVIVDWLAGVVPGEEIEEGGYESAYFTDDIEYAATEDEEGDTEEEGDDTEEDDMEEGDVESVTTQKEV
ncbi:hypothetical protein BJY52DRAFT_1183211 [Lactarius psammicola]|nr:hypothetical protein BJY52DRAFT_1183211 [Lactarius psammicola]